MSTLYERYTDEPETTWNVRGNTWMAQKITIGTTGTNENHDIDKLSLYLKKTGSDFTFNVEIQGVDDDGYPDGSVKSSGSVSSSELSGSLTWVDISMSSFTMQANGEYTIVAYETGGDSSNYAMWAKGANETDQYTGGFTSKSRNGGSSWRDYEQYYYHDLPFKEYGTKAGEEAAVFMVPNKFMGPH